MPHSPRSDESQWYSVLYPEYDTGMFNWTMTFHSDSDVPVPYGRVVRGEGQEAGRNYHGERPGNCTYIFGHLKHNQLFFCVFA